MGRCDLTDDEWKTLLARLRRKSAPSPRSPAIVRDSSAECDERPVAQQLDYWTSLRRTSSWSDARGFGDRTRRRV